MKRKIKVFVFPFIIMGFVLLFLTMSCTKDDILLNNTEWRREGEK